LLELLIAAIVIRLIQAGFRVAQLANPDALVAQQIQPKAHREEIPLTVE
jgi:hypothetical protein